MVEREAEWRPHQTIPGRASLFLDKMGSMPLDTLEAHLQFCERMMRGDSLQIKNRLQKEVGPA